MKAHAQKIADGVYWIGVLDWDLRTYHGYTLDGTTYNAYIVFGEDEVEIISRSSLVGSANEKLNVFQFSGERLEISFRASFVADAIRACKSEDVTIAFIGEMKPFVVKNSKDDTIDMLVTPLRS